MGAKSVNYLHTYEWPDKIADISQRHQLVSLGNDVCTNPILMMFHYADLGSASDWLRQIALPKMIPHTVRDDASPRATRSFLYFQSEFEERHLQKIEQYDTVRGV